ncbi:MAG: hypothetical protein AAF146_25220, partial [Bacteroidota bacterium]
RITGVEAGENQRDNFVYFDLASSELPPDEAAEVDAFLAQHPKAPEIHLYGYASEEGKRWYNLLLIEKRMEAVERRLRKPPNGQTPFAGKIIHHSRLGFSKNKARYRSFRTVELSTGASSLGETSATENRDCTADENKAIDAARDNNIKRVSTAINKLKAFVKDPKKEKTTQAVLDNNFMDHSAGTVTTLLEILDQIKAKLGTFSGNSKRRCGDEDYNICLTAKALTGTDDIIFCPKFFKVDPSLLIPIYPTWPDIQTMILLHEMNHFIDLNLPDRSYTKERVFRFLSTKQRLNNADSIAVFVAELIDPKGLRVKSTLTEKPKDAVNNCGTNGPVVEEALAWAQRWNTYAMFGSQQVYNSAWGRRKMRASLRKHLGRLNRFDLAGVADRYKQLYDLFAKNWTINCRTAAEVPCQGGGRSIQMDTKGKSFEVCPTFYAHSLDKRTTLLYMEMTRLVPPIRKDQRRAYARLAKDYKEVYFNTKG